LSRLLSLFGAKLHFVSPEQLRMPAKVTDELTARGISYAEHTTLSAVLPETDVLYVTRVQKERFEDLALYESLKHAFIITPETMKLAKPKMALMHPLPRAGRAEHQPSSSPMWMPRFATASPTAWTSAFGRGSAVAS
jgi:aspartate carbamoyltransferase catalytic subunit